MVKTLLKEKTKMKKMINFMVKSDSVTLIFTDGPRTISRGQPAFESILQALRDRDMDAAERLANPITTIRRFLSESGNCEVVDDEIFFKGEKLTGYTVTKIFEFMRDSLPWEYMLTFLDNLQDNPSFRAREELYRFLETENLPVTEDGHFLAYKRVREDWKDWHSGTIENTIGKIVEMPRRGVNDDQAIGCSNGLHAGSLDYVKNFHNNGHILIVKINPKDVVCIPTEDVRKLRCCKYEVLKEMSESLLNPSYSANGETALGKAPSEAKVNVIDTWDAVRDDVLDEIQSNLENNSEWEEPTDEYDPYDDSYDSYEDSSY